MNFDRANVFESKCLRLKSGVEELARITLFSFRHSRISVRWDPPDNFLLDFHNPEGLQKSGVEDGT